MRLAGKMAVITGAAGDIGKAAAQRFHDEGALLGLIDRDKEGLVSLRNSICTRHLGVDADISDEDAVREAADLVRSRFGEIHILLVAAGIEQPHAPLTDLSMHAFEQVIATNLTGTFLTAKHLMPLVADGGSVMFISSIAGLMPFPAYSAYSASKAGLVGLMRSASLDVAPRRIRCNTIHPGPVKSRMLQRAALEATGGAKVEEWYEAMSRMARMGRLVDPPEVAALALFLASDESRMITGQSIAIDGGIVQ